MKKKATFLSNVLVLENIVKFYNFQVKINLMRGVPVLLFICFSSQVLVRSFTQRWYLLSNAEDMNEHIIGYIIVGKGLFLSSYLLIYFIFYFLILIRTQREIYSVNQFLCVHSVLLTRGTILYSRSLELNISHK